MESFLGDRKSQTMPKRRPRYGVPDPGGAPGHKDPGPEPPDTRLLLQDRFQVVWLMISRSGDVRKQRKRQYEGQYPFYSGVFSHRIRP